MSTDYPLGQPADEIPALHVDPPTLPATNRLSEPTVNFQLVQAEGNGPVLLTPAAKPPGSGFWMALVWSLLFVVFLNGIVLVVFGFGLLVTIARSGDPKDFLAKLSEPEFQTSDEFYQLIADALAPAMLLGELASIAFALVMLRMLVGKDWRRSLSFRWPSVAQLVLVLLGLPGMMVLASGIHQAAFQVLPSMGDANFSLLKECFRRWPPWFGVLAIGLGPGIGEELWCRGFLGRGLVGRYGYLLGVLITSVLFGLMHLDPPHAVATAMMGICLHGTYLATRSMWVPILLHVLNNSLGVVLALCNAPDFLEPSTIVGQVFKYAASVFLVATVGWALYQCRTRVVIATEAGWLPWTGAYPGMEYPPAACGPRSIRPQPSWLALGMVALALFSFATTIYYYV